MLKFNKPQISTDRDDEINVTLITREQEIRKVKKDMTEVNGLMTSIYGMVESQSPMVDNIQANITTVKTDIEYGTDQLTQVKETDKKLCCCVSQTQVLCGILSFIVFVCIIIVIILVVVKIINHG